MIFTDRKALPGFPGALKAAAMKSVIKAGDWLVRTQVRDKWPSWNANKGRFIYHILIDPKKRGKSEITLSTCWKTARAAQGLYSAYSLTGRKEYLESANLACDYVCSLQFLEPGMEKWHGTFREDSPHGPHLALRDGTEAIQAFINGFLLTGNERYLRRSVLGTDFMLNNFKKRVFPWGVAFPFGGKPASRASHFCYYAGALVFAQMWSITGKEAYISKAMVPMADYILDNFIMDNGALGSKHPGEASHHTSMPGKYAGVISNDDGVGVALLSAYRITGAKKYLMAARGMADFWVDTGLEPVPVAAFGSIGLFFSDLYRVTGDTKYLPVIEKFTRKIVSLQCDNPRDPLVNGGYIGEDMAKHYDKSTDRMDYVDLRTTSYAMIALPKVAAKSSRQWGCAYSCFGW